MNYLIGIVIAALIAALGWQTLELEKERTAHQTTKKEHSDKVADQERRAREAVEEVRGKEAARVAALEGIIHEKAALLESAETDAAAARLSSDRLRDKLARIAAAANARSENPSAAPASTPVENTTVVLADLFSRADKRAGDLAEFATRAHTAGQICEDSYDGVRAVNASD